MRESLRLAPTAPGRMVSPIQDTTLQDGRYAIAKDTLVFCNLYKAQRDPKVWGDDVRAGTTSNCTN